MFRYILIVLPLVLNVPGPGFAAPRPPETYAAEIEGRQAVGEAPLDSRRLTDIMQEVGVPGMSIAVIWDFRIHWAKSYGLADVDSGAPVANSTLFQAASISKPVAAMAVLRAVQHGRFSLDDDINRILTSWKAPKSQFSERQPITPRTLLSHTSGLGDGFGFPGYRVSEPLPTLVQILDGQKPSKGGPVRMVRAPMVDMQYSGGGTIVMQLALEDSTGVQFARLMRESVLGPLDMSSSRYEQPLSEQHDRQAARAHDEAGNAMEVKWNVYPELAAAGLWTTAVDLAKFVIEVQASVHGRANRVLSRSTVQEMLNPVGVGDFAVGFEIERRGEGWYFKHTGSNWGFRSALIGHKVKGYGLVVMTNGSRGYSLIPEVLRRVERAYDWDSRKKSDEKRL